MSETNPQSGGRWIRDEKTGELTRAPAEAPAPDVSTPSASAQKSKPAPEASSADKE